MPVIRVHPIRPAPPTLAPIPLTSVSSVCAPHASALIVFDADGAKALHPQELQRSLSYILSAYPQLCGRLRVARADDPGPQYMKRYLRTWMEYGENSDPGFLFDLERRSAPISSILPAETGYEGVLDLEHTADMSLAPSLSQNVSAERLSTGIDSNAGVKLTQFTNGAAMCLSANHMLCDAGALGQFLIDWVCIHTALQAGEASPALPQRDFDWRIIDDSASGDLNADEEDPGLTQIEGRLDVLRYDSWARNKGSGPQPPPALDAKPHPDIESIDAARGRPRGAVPPWETLSGRPLVKYAIFFESADVRRIYNIAASTNEIEVSDCVISVQDAFAAHLWRAIARSRLQENDNTLLEFTMACDCRGRFRTPLPAAQPGCFNVCLGLNAPASAVLGNDAGVWAARRIRKAIGTVDAESLGAWLHRRAHDLDPTREMIVFPGNRSVCTTNWARSGLFDVNFGSGRPVFVHNLVQAFGGYATIMRQCGGPLDRTSAKWYEPGLYVELWLEDDAMRRLVCDPHLRG